MKCMFPTLTELTTDTECALPLLRVTPSHESFYYNVENIHLMMLSKNALNSQDTKVPIY